MTSRTPSRSHSTASLPLSSSASRTRSNTALDEFLAANKEKVGLIDSACREKDISALILLAQGPNGLLADKLRRAAWPILLGCECDDSSEKKEVPWTELPAHRDEEQVAKDVNRAFVHYPRESDRQLDRRKEDLSNVIVEVLRRHPSLCYFQGYHDIVQVLYLVLGVEDAPSAVTRLSLIRIRDFMLPRLDPAISHLYLIPPLLKSADPVLYEHLPKIQPNYALGATLTLFSHVIIEYGDITRLFDFFLASDAVIPIYFFIAIIISRRDELLELEKDEDEAIFFVILGKLPQPFDIDTRIKDALELYSEVPPHKLPGWAWWNVSSSSVLKATQTPLDASRLPLAEGESLFKKQEVEVRRKHIRDQVLARSNRLRRHIWLYKRPGVFGLAIAVGVYALWLGRSSGTPSPLSTLGPIAEYMKRIMGIFV